MRPAAATVAAIARGGSVAATRPPPKVGAAVANALAVAGCSTCAAAATAKPPLEPLPKAMGGDASGLRGWASRLPARRPAADRAGCGFAAVAQPTTGEPAGWRPCWKGRLRNWRRPCPSCFWLLADLQTAWLGAPEPGEVGLSRNRLPEWQHGAHPAPAHAEGVWQAIQGRLASASGL